GSHEVLEFLGARALPVAEYLGSQREIQDSTKFQPIAQRPVERRELSVAARCWRDTEPGELAAGAAARPRPFRDQDDEHHQEESSMVPRHFVVAPLTAGGARSLMRPTLKAAIGR